MVIALEGGIEQPYARSSPSTPPPLLPRPIPGAKGGQAFYRYRELSCIKARGRRGAKRFIAIANFPVSKPGGEGGPSVCGEALSIKNQE